MPTAYLLLGSNLGDRQAILRTAAQELHASAGPVTAASALYETAAWGREDQPAFLNQALAVATSLAPEQLLDACLDVEQRAGRERRLRWGARTLDVDILLYADVVLQVPRLTVPHPALAARRFALVPLAEIAAAAVHPIWKKTVADLLAQCSDPLPVRQFQGF